MQHYSSRHVSMQESPSLLQFRLQKNRGSLDCSGDDRDVEIEGGSTKQVEKSLFLRISIQPSGLVFTSRLTTINKRRKELHRL